MTTYVNFTPSATANFQFIATLDGSPCTIVCTWSAYGQRYYFNVYDMQQNILLSRPLTGSPDNYSINLLAGVFITSSIVYRVSSNNIELT